MKIAMVSTWKVNCGVGIYTESLAGELSKLTNIKVFAETIDSPQVEKEALPEAKNVSYERCWTRYQGYDKLKISLYKYEPDIVHFQFVSGVYNELAFKENSPFQQLVNELRSKNIKVIITFHDIPPYNPESSAMKKWYKSINAQYIVLNIDMSAGLRQWYPEANINLIPLGTPIFDPISIPEARKKLNLNENDFLLTQMGFYGIDKGMLDIIKALPNIDIPNLKLVFAGGFHPLASQIHFPHVNECIKLAIKLHLMQKVVFLNKILSEDEINLWCSTSNFIITNQQLIFSGTGTSASAHRILCSKRPIIMSQSPKLGEFLHGIHCVKAYPENIADAITKLYKDKILQNKIVDGALSYAKETSFDKIAQKHIEVYKKCL